MSNFEHQIEKKVKKDIYFNKGEKVYVQGNVAKYFLRKILSKYLVAFVKRKKDADKIVVQRTLDDKIDEFLYNFLYKKNNLKTKSEIILFKNITDKELKEYCRIKGIKFTPRKKHLETQKLIYELEKKFPQIRFSLLKSIKELEKII
ncbi:MAG: hypothetical protein QW331_00175 [Candidatus Woesearchaeota archaeon]